MSVKRTMTAYADCYRIMDEVLKAKGGTMEFHSSSAANTFRHRCYKGRSLLFKANEATLRKGEIPSTPYDDIYIIKKPGWTKLDFRLRSMDPLPNFTPATPEEAHSGYPQEIDEWAEAVKNLRGLGE
jgi:hypothetical protein